MENKFDIDIDVPDRQAVLSVIPGITAMQMRNDRPAKHNTGVYFLDIPSDPRTGISNIEYNEAEDLGYMKIDLLNVHLYDGIASEEELLGLMGEPDWNMLHDATIVEQLFQISSYYELIDFMSPDSIIKLAMVLAIIRPSKQYLVGKTWGEIERDIWTKPLDGAYYFKKSHAISYAQAIVVQMNMISKSLNGLN